MEIKSDKDLNNTLAVLELKYNIISICISIITYVFSIIIVYIMFYANAELLIRLEGIFVVIDTLYLIKSKSKKKHIVLSIVYIILLGCISYFDWNLLNNEIITYFFQELGFMLTSIPVFILFNKEILKIIKIFKCIESAKYYSYENLIIIRKLSDNSKVMNRKTSDKIL